MNSYQYLSGTVISTEEQKWELHFCILKEILKERKKIAKSVGGLRKKAQGLGGGLVSNNVYKMVVRKEAAGREKWNQSTRKCYSLFLLLVEILDTFLCYAFPQIPIVFFFLLFLFFCSTIYIYMNNLVCIVNNKYKENHQGPWTHKRN